MQRPRSIAQTRHIRPGVTINAVKEFLESVFSALWFRVEGTEMTEMFGGDPLTLSADPGTSYIPSNYAGTITAPDVAGLKTADVDNILYTAGGDANDLSVSDFIDADLERIPVYYDSSDPYHIRMIGLFDPTAYLTLTDADKIKISNYMKLWIFYWDALLGGVIKDNRAIGSNPELNTLANATSPTNEANATTGWSQYGLDSGANVFASQSSVKTNGSYAIMASANDTPVSLARFWFDFAQLSLVEGEEYTISFDIRAVGGGDSWRYGFSSGSNNDTTVTLDSMGGAETTFVGVSYDFTYGAAYRYIVFRESSGSNNGGFYIDNVSIKKKMSKEGLLSIRIDNPYIGELEGALTDLTDLFDTYGVKALIAENLESNIIRSGETYKIAEYEAIEENHEVADTTPSDSVDYFKIPTGYESTFTPYVGNGITEIISAEPYDIAVLERIHLKDLSTKQIGAENGYTLGAGTNRITGDFSSRPHDLGYLYIDNLVGDKIGWQPIKTITDTYADIKTVYGTDILFDADETVTMYYQYIGVLDVILTEQATYLLFLAGQCWFNFLGLKTNKCWIHPGGQWARIKDEYAMSAMESLGMKFSDTYDATLSILTYNYNRDTKYAGHTWGGNSALEIDTIFSSGDIEDTKKYIAEHIALHHHITIKTHTYFTDMPGATNADKIAAHLAAWEDFLPWIQAQGIRTVTYSEMRERMIDATPDPTINIIPNMYTDKASQGKPDGYTLGGSASWVEDDGVAADNTHSISLNGNGELFTINDLGALEKTSNSFSINIKGTVGAVITVQFGSLGSAIFTITDADWNEFDLSDSSGITTLTIPSTTNFLDITCTASNNTGNDIFVSGMNLKQA